MKTKFRVLAAAAALGLIGGVALSQPISVPQVTSINPTDLFQDVVNGVPQPGNVYAPASLLASTIGPGGPSRGNAIIGGDGTTNLWQRGTAGVSSTSATVAWNSADRWGQWATASAGVKIVRDSTAADLPAGYKYAIALTHTNTTGGQICMGQSIESVNAYQFQGQTAELDFNAATGSGYSGTALTAYITYGTGADEGLNYAAYTINAGGSTGFTGGANAASAVVPLTAVSTSGRYAVVVPIPSTATEMAVAFCYTAGTTDTNDYVAFDGIQIALTKINASFANPVAAINGATTANFAQAAFDHRLQNIETLYQLRYYYELDESAVIYPIASCASSTTSIAVCYLQFPVMMRTTPTMSYANGFAISLIAQTSVAACTTLQTSTVLTSSAAWPGGVPLSCAGTLTGDIGGVAATLFSNNSTGKIKASAEL